MMSKCLLLWRPKDNWLISIFIIPSFSFNPVDKCQSNMRTFEWMSSLLDPYSEKSEINHSFRLTSYILYFFLSQRFTWYPWFLTGLSSSDIFKIFIHLGINIFLVIWIQLIIDGETSRIKVSWGNEKHCLKFVLKNGLRFTNKVPNNNDLWDV